MTWCLCCAAFMLLKFPAWLWDISTPSFRWVHRSAQLDSQRIQLFHSGRLIIAPFRWLHSLQCMSSFFVILSFLLCVWFYSHLFLKFLITHSLSFSGFLENVAPVHEKQTHHQKYFTAADSTSVGEKLCCLKIMTRKVEMKGSTGGGV